MRVHRTQLGLTLIELMIVITIIAILAAIAISQYQLYTGRTQTVRVISELSQLRTTVEECLASGRTVIGLGLNECDPRATGSTLVLGSSQVGVPLPNNTGNAQLTNPLTSTSSIIATLSAQAHPNLGGKKIKWLRNDQGSWRCSSNIKANYLPTYCIYDSGLS